MKPIAAYKNWKNKLSTIENPGLNLSVQTLRDNSYENYTFDDLQFFVKHHIPKKVSKETIAKYIEDEHPGFTIEEGMDAWYEHDALHYLSLSPFSDNGERSVKYLEQIFHRGWLPHGHRYNPYAPKECRYSHITQELITETAELIKCYWDT